MSKEILRALIVEDSEDDFELLLRELNKGKYETHYELVEDNTGFNSALKKKWDIIISDYSLPNFNGFEALNLCNDKGIDTPFIMVSGTVGEDIAVNMMKAGAKDYIMKNSLKRLMPAVEREIEDHRTRIKNKLKAKEKEIIFEINQDILNNKNLEDLLKRIYENINKVIVAENCHIALYNTDKDEISFPLYIDKFNAQPPPRIRGNGITEFILKTRSPLILDSGRFKKFLKDNKIKTSLSAHESLLCVPLVSHSKPIGVISVASYNEEVKYTENEKDFLTGIANQIALAIEKKQAEETIKKSEERYRVFINSTNDMAFLKDDEFKYLLVNKANADFFEKEEKDIIGQTDFEFMEKNVAQKCLQTDEKAILSDDIIISEETVKDRVFETHKFRVPLVHGKYGVGGYIRDITERRWAENDLRKNEEHYRTLLKAIPDMMFRLDANYRIIDYHAEDLSVLFVPPKKFFGKHFNEVLPPEIAKQFAKSIEKSHKTGEITKFEYEAEIPDGRKCYYEARVTYYRDEIVVIIRDITERKESEEALQKSEERFQLAARATNDIIYDWNLKNGEGWFSGSYTKLFGYDDTTAVFDYWKENIHPEDLKKALFITDSVINGGGESWTTEYRFKRENGSYAYVLDRGYVIRDKNKKAVRLIGSIIDFTERKKAEEALRKSEEKYRSIFENVQDVFYQLNNEGIITEISPSVEKYINYKRENLIGKTSDVFYQNTNNRDMFLQEMQEKGKVTDYEIKLVTNDGIVRDASVSAHLRYDENNNIAGIEGSLRDITERKRIQEALMESEEQYRKLYELSPETIYVQSEGNIVFINPAGLKLLKAKDENEIIGRKVLDFIHPEFREIVSNRMADIRNNSANAPLKEEKYICLDGSIVDVEVIGTAFTFKGKGAALVVLRDITERKKYEVALKESEERYRILIETMHDGVMQVDNDDKIQFVNNSMCDILGYTYHELIGKVGTETIIFKDDWDIVREKNRTRLKGISDIYEVRGIKKTGEIIWLNVSGTPIGDKSGKVIGSVGFLSDITERKRAEEEVIKISQAIKQSPVTVVITDIKGDIEYVNPKFVEVTGYRPEEVIGSNPRVLKSGEKTSEEYKDLWDTILKGNDWIGEFHNKKKNGELYWEKASISPVKNSEGKITHFLAVKEDVTEKKLKEEELIKAKEKAEESERLKSSFLANMSHELRTPMVGILGFAELLRDMTDNPELKDFSDNILRSGKRLLETLNLILDLSRIEAGKLEMKSSEVDIVQLTNEVYQSYTAEAAKKKIKFTIESSAEQILSKVDERMLWEAINNLINNAIKYTKSGEVKIELSINENKKAVMKISDTGIGIPKESIGVIFEEFRQVSEGYSRGFEGTGLGLTITKNFIEKIGGSITVESEMGVGSVFKIELPLLESEIVKQPVKEIEDEKELLPQNKEVHVLCVDDDSFTREYLDYVLKDVYKLSFAENGIAAIEMAKSQKFNLILMDINLGKGMDGIEATRKVHKLPGYSVVPVIAMTAFAMKGDREEFINAGLTDYISKPFKSNELIKLVNSVLLKNT